MSDLAVLGVISLFVLGFAVFILKVCFDVGTRMEERDDQSLRRYLREQRQRVEKVREE